MSAISTILARLRSAIWAIDVRDDIADAIEQCYSDVSNPTLQTDALEAAIQEKIDEGEMAALTIGDGTITAAKLAANAVTTPKIADGSITQAKLDPNIDFVQVDDTLSQTGEAADAAAVGAAIDELNGSLETQEEKMLDVETTVGKFESVAIDEQLWINHSVWATTGEIVEDSTSDIRITHRELIGLDGEGITFYTKAGYQFLVFRFLKSGVFDGTLRTNGTFSKVGNSNIANVDSYTVSERDSKAYLYRFALKKEDNGNITPADSAYFLYALNDTITAVQNKLTRPKTNGENGQVVVSDGDGGTRWEDMPSENIELYDALKNLLLDAYYKNDNHADDIQTVLRATCTRKICYENLILSDGVVVSSGLESLYIS